MLPSNMLQPNILSKGGCWLVEHANGTQGTKQSWACCTGISTYHVGYKATVAPPAPLVIITGPHDFDTSQVAKSAKLFLQNLLIHIR